MNDNFALILAFIAGIVLGILFFYGLWITVRKAVTSKMPALWLSGSFFIRTGITLAGFYFVAHGKWQRLLICMLGFIAARYMVKRYTKPKEENQLNLKKEADHGA